MIKFQKDLKKTDEELVNLALGDENYFIYIIKRYKGKLYNYIRRLTNLDAEDIEDVLQDVFIKVYQNLNDFDLDLKFSSWIYRIAHNQTISHYRRAKARPHGNAIDLDNEFIKNLASDFNIEKNMDINLLRKGIYKILDGLNEKYREVLVLKFFEEKNYKEISDIIKKPVGTVASLLNRAKREFREELTRQKIKL